MDHVDFIMTLECIGLRNDLRLIMNRAPVGCGIFFYFIDDKSDTYSKDIVWRNGRESPESLFESLEVLAKDFKEELGKNDS